MLRLLTLAALVGLLAPGMGCALFATRPVQDMSDTQAAVRAAQEVQADTLAPDLYRQAQEYWLKAKREYRFKNYAESREFAKKAREFAEQAEFEAIRAGGNRMETPPDPSQPSP